MRHDIGYKLGIVFAQALSKHPQSMRSLREIISKLQELDHLEDADLWLGELLVLLEDIEV